MLMPSLVFCGNGGAVGPENGHCQCHQQFLNCESEHEVPSEQSGRRKVKANSWNLIVKELE